VFTVKPIRNLLLIVILLLSSQLPSLAAEGVKLPAPAHKGAMSLEEALSQRRSVRQYAAKPLTLQQVSQLL
jgi:hypothetical protein